MKRCICLLLVVLLLIGSLPTVFAAEMPGMDEPTTENTPSATAEEVENTVTDVDSSEPPGDTNTAEENPSADNEETVIIDTDNKENNDFFIIFTPYFITQKLKACKKFISSRFFFALSIP